MKNRTSGILPGRRLLPYRLIFGQSLAQCHSPWVFVEPYEWACLFQVPSAQQIAIFRQGRVVCNLILQVSRSDGKIDIRQIRQDFLFEKEEWRIMWNIGRHVFVYTVASHHILDNEIVPLKVRSVDHAYPKWSLSLLLPLARLIRCFRTCNQAKWHFSHTANYTTVSILRKAQAAFFQWHPLALTDHQMIEHIYIQ